MLCLNRKKNEVICIKNDMTGDKLTLVIVDIKGKCVRLGFEDGNDPQLYSIFRKELQEKIDKKDNPNPYYRDQPIYIEEKKHGKRSKERFNTDTRGTRASST